MRRRLSAALVCLTLATAGTAVASEDGGVTNDRVETATRIAALPFDDESDTSTATTGPEDSNSLCSPEAGYSVWYEYTPTEDEALAVDIDANFYPVLELFQGTDLETVDCAFGQFSNRTTLVADLTAGTRYFLRVASPYDYPGWYALHAERHVPFTVDVSVADRARLTSGGRAEVRATVSCSEPAYVHLAMDGRQALGPVATVGDGEAVFACTGVHEITVRVHPRAGAFIPGRLDVDWSVYSCADDDRIESQCVTPTGAQESLLLPL